MPDAQFEPRPSVLVGETADVYLHRALATLRAENLNPIVTMDFYSGGPGVFCGIEEVKVLLERVLPETEREVWALEEGAWLDANEVALRIKAHYAGFALYETAICGTLAQCSGWATAARACVEAAQDVPTVCFGARYVHPNSVALMDYSAIVGGCTSCSTVLGGKLAGVSPHGTFPHSLVLVVGDPVKAMQAFDKHIPPEVPRLAVVDTLGDEVEGSLAIARGMRGRLRGIRLDPPSSRGRVTVELIHEVRARLDLSGFQHVEIFVSGSLTPDRIRELVAANAPANGFGVGYHIASAPPVPFLADIYEIDDKPVARRGRIPGAAPSKRLQQIL